MILLLFIFLCLALPMKSTRAENPAEDKTHKSSVQNVGGILFDVDEGVKVEEGPGGSVYVKSNREVMEQKFKKINRELEELSERLGKLEAVVFKDQTKPEAKKQAAREGEGANRRVLAT